MSKQGAAVKPTAVCRGEEVFSSVSFFVQERTP